MHPFDAASTLPMSVIAGSADGDSFDSRDVRALSMIIRVCFWPTAETIHRPATLSATFSWTTPSAFHLIASLSHSFNPPSPPAVQDQLIELGP